MSNAVTRLITEDNTLYVHTDFNDDAALRRNKQIKDAELLSRPKLGIHDNADLRFVISIPDVNQWNIWKRKHPHEYKALMTAKDHDYRLKAAKFLALSHPEWVIFERH